MAFLWSLLIVDPLIVLSTIVCGSVSYVVSFFEQAGRRQMKVARAWARSLLFFAGIRVKVEGLDRLDRAAGYVFVSNHLSYMDTPVALSHIPVEFRFLAKKGLFRIPFLGTYLRRGGHISVPREDPRAAVKSLTRAAEIVREHGTSVLIFPEGGRSLDGTLGPFKEGAAYIAIKAGVAVVPVAMIGTREVLPMGSATFHRGAVRLKIGHPVPTAGLTMRDRQAVTGLAREQIVNLLQT
jgi:1-acyl-sn-glycerol-3-phosphate acyltransferase